MYKTPEKYYFRLHHIRPRFKKDIENVLIYIASELVELGNKPHVEFKNLFNEKLRLYPGNQIKELKTINNWRTEITSLFGFVQKDETSTYASLRAKELADNSDLVQTFKKFLYLFQYPGGHLKPHENQKLIEAGIKFKPVKYILELLVYAEKKEKKRCYVNKAELTHIVFNDLRCTRDHQNVSKTWETIQQNRERKIKYDWGGDITRYAGDILDYMEIADLLVSHNNAFYLNHVEDIAIHNFVNSNTSFDGYDKFLQKHSAEIQNIRELEQKWFEYVNQKLDDNVFKTDILAFVSKDVEEYENLKNISKELLDNQLDEREKFRAKEIGDWGESLIHGHECMRIKLAGHPELVHLIQRIPTQFGVGYDIKSIEEDATQRLIEVKTTISLKPIEFEKIHLTPNEWSAADSFKDRYYVYRLAISKNMKKLFIIQNPVGLYKKDKLKMIPRNGADITFSDDTCGRYEELLEWKN